MQKINNIILKTISAMFAVVLAAGCVFEKENPTATRDHKNVLVQLGIRTDGMIQTRADASLVGNEAATSAEKLVSSLRVYAYIDGALCGYLEDFDGVKEGEALLMDLRLPASGDVTVDFVAIANEQNMSGTGDQISVSVERNAQGTLTFSKNIGMDEFNKIVYALADQDFAKVGIPMYATGSKTINTNNVDKMNDADGHEGHFILKDILNITLTRSLAKVAVYAAEEGPAAEEGETEKYNVKINSVTISNVISSGNLFPGQTLPTGFAQSHAMSTTEVLVNKKIDPTSGTFNTDRSNPENFTLLTPTPYYIPENGAGNTGTSYKWDEEVDKATKITVNYTTGSESTKDAVIFLPKIQRNNFYKILCLIKANGEIKLTLQVLPWTVGNGTNVNFTDQPSFDSSYGLQWNGVKLEGTNEYMLDTPAGSSVTCTFNITAPVGGKWYATLTDGDIQNYEIIGGTEGTDKASGNINGLATFTIKTKNSNFESPSLRDVKLVITAVDKNGRSMVLDFNEQGFFIVKQDNN